MYGDTLAEPPRPGRQGNGNLLSQDFISPDYPVFNNDFDKFNPPIVYQPTVTARKSSIDYYSNDEPAINHERIDCTPDMCSNKYVLLRWLEMFIFFVLHWLVQITCARFTCTMILTEFGYKAYGQAFVLCALALLAACCGLILIGYATNMHKLRPLIILNFERGYAVIGIVLMTLCGIVGTYYSIMTSDVDINLMGRGSSGIRPQWIIAAVLEFLTAGLFIYDYLGQSKYGFPFVYNSATQTENEEKLKRQQEKLLDEQRAREHFY